MKGKLKVYFANHQPRTWVYRVYSLFFIEKKQLQTSLLSKQNQKRDNFPSTVFESNEHGLSFPVFVGLIQRGLANILIRTSRLCRNGSFSQIKCFDRLQSYMTVNLLGWMYVTFSWKKANWFQGRFFNVSRPSLSHEIIVFHSRAILHKAERTFLYSFSILKSFVNGHFLKVVIDAVSF